jgi:hypothetical protein
MSRYNKKSTEELAMEAVRAHVAQHGIGNSLNGYDPNGDPEGIVNDHKDLVGISAGTEIILKEMADYLTKHFIGFRWAIQPDERGGVFNVFCLDFSGRYGYRIRYEQIVNDPKRYELKKAASEILRRFRYPGRKYKPELMAEVPRNTRGEAIPDVSDKKKDRFTVRTDLELALATGKARVVGTKGSGQVIEVHK